MKPLSSHIGLMTITEWTRLHKSDESVLDPKSVYPTPEQQLAVWKRYTATAPVATTAAATVKSTVKPLSGPEFRSGMNLNPLLSDEDDDDS